jgi:outer membrane protein insertion porin family
MFQVGVGFSSEDSFIASARAAQSNLFGTGLALSVSTVVAKRREEMLLRLHDPDLFGSPFGLTMDLYGRRKDHPGFSREARGGALTLSRPLARNVEAFLGYSIEHVQVRHDDTAAQRSGVPASSIVEPRTWNGGVLASLRAGVEYSSLDSRVDPMRGTALGVATQISDRRLGSDLDFTRTDAWLSHHRRLGAFTLHLGGKVSMLGARYGHRGFADVPVSERLHFDGARDVRGFLPGEIGPRDPVTGLPTGGTLSWSARGELEAPLIRSAGISLAGFVDAGGLYDRGVGERGIAAGFGVIWRSPIGPLRFDVAFPLDLVGGPRYVFGLGTSF